MPRAAKAAEVRGEVLLTELLSAQGWNVERPPRGELLRQHEYKAHPNLLDIFQGKSKAAGGGAGLPEAVLVDRESLEPLAVVEVKPDASQLQLAIREVTEVYGRACIDADYSPLAVALAGSSEDSFEVRVLKWAGRDWRPITYDGKPINWIPNREDVSRLRSHGSPLELRPSVPPPEVLAARADEINRLLRESKIQDAMRPAAVGAIMLALWQSKGNIRKEAAHILADINAACRSAFWKAKKAELAESLRVDEANQTLAVKTRRIVTILERLNVTVLTAEHDYLGQLYETFFRYTGGNTIGQYFTPRHIASLMADILEVGPNDIVFDPACGTGGFLIAAMNRLLVSQGLSRSQMVKVIQKRLMGLDSEPVTAALCVANMILRGDGTTGVRRGDCFTWPQYPIGKTSVVMMNPPFPHKKTDTPPENFVDRALEALQQGGRAAIIVPMSTLVKKDRGAWRSRLLSRNSLNGVIGLPDDLFEPYASSYTAVLLLTKGIPHPTEKPVFFARLQNDGYKVRKGVKAPREGEELTATLLAYRTRGSVPGLCGWAVVESGEALGPGLYVAARPLPDEEVIREVASLARNRAAFVVRHAPELWAMEVAVARGELVPRASIELRKAGARVPSAATIGDYFSISYGQKALHSKERLTAGPALVISSSGTDNGCYGFFDYDNVILPPFATVPSTGSIGMAHVQEWPCGVTDDCLLLFPKQGVTSEMLYVACAVVRSESWRFNYGMKITPSRIAGFPLPATSAVLDRVREQLEAAKRIEKVALEAAEDDADLSVARQRLEEIAASPSRLIANEALAEKLRQWRE
jgi:type I restriction enzyme M protein